jgi:hypothetical protein
MLLEGFRTVTSLVVFLSFHAFWMDMQPQIFHTGTAAERRTHLSAALQMVPALPSRASRLRGGAAMFTRSTPGCGILDAPSLALAWAAYLWPKLRRFKGSPGQTLPSSDGILLTRLTSDFHMVVYTWYVPGISCLVVKHAFWIQLHLCPAISCCIHAFPVPPTCIASLKAGKT